MVYLERMDTQPFFTASFGYPGLKYCLKLCLTVFILLSCVTMLNLLLVELQKITYRAKAKCVLTNLQSTYQIIHSLYNYMTVHIVLMLIANSCILCRLYL